MELSSRQKTLFLLLLAIATVFLIATGLPSLQLRPGLPIPGSAGEPAVSGQAQTGQAWEAAFPPILQGVLAVVFVALLLFFARSLFSQASLTVLLRVLIFLLAVLGLMALIPRLQPAAPSQPAGEAGAVFAPPEFEYEVTPLGSPPPGLAPLVAAGLAGIAVLLAFDYYRRQRRYAAGEDRVLQEAAQAVEAIRSGGDLKNTIIACYVKMSQALQEEQGIERGQSVTAREFETLLEVRGLPREPIHRLTRLFEAARYGDGQAGELDEQAAVACLTDIIAWLQGAKGVRPA